MYVGHLVSNCVIGGRYYVLCTDSVQITRWTTLDIPSSVRGVSSADCAYASYRLHSHMRRSNKSC